MPEALPPISQIAFPDFRVVTASAGSGKTWTLTRRFVQFLLSERVHSNAPQNILAITFTNNAAAEMKRRILEILKGLALNDQKAVSELSGLVDLRSDHIPARAEALLGSILDNYSEFQVRTIDSFLANVFQSSAVEFGYPPDYQIVLSADGLLDRAFREFSVRLADDASGMRLLRELVELQDEHRDDDDRYLWDPFAAIAYRVRKLYRETATLSDSIVAPNLTKEHQKAERSVNSSAKALTKFLLASDLPLSSHLMKDLSDIEEERIAAVLDRTEKAKIFTSGRDKTEKNAIEAASGRAEQLLSAYNSALRAYGFLQTRRVFIPYARALEMMEQTLDDIKRREGLVLLDDVNRTLGGYLSRQTIPDVYVKLGERLSHYLIDEFQDTAPVQYIALAPLWEETLGEDGSVFVVGDTKQSIYSFRGADYRIMRRMLREQVFPSAPTQIATLDKNYRSRSSIVAVNSGIFRETLPASDLAAASRASGLDSDRQETAHPELPPGQVRIVHIERDKAVQPELTAVSSIVKGWLDQGYHGRDIAVLTPANENVVRVSSQLNADGIDFISQSSLDIRNRTIISELLALLRFLDAPVDDAAFAEFLLSDIFDKSGAGLDRDSVRDLLARAAEQRQRPPLYKIVQSLHRTLWDGFIERLFTRVGYLPLYDLVAEVFKTFRVFERFPEEEASLVRFLETVRDVEATGRNSVRDLVRAADEGPDDVSWELPTPEGHDAVTVMTVHKAKGLGFPAVCVLLYPRKLSVDQPIPVSTENGIELWRVKKGDAERYPEAAPFYEDALLQKQVDELNRLYVSLTRAKVEMTVVSVYDKETDLPHRLLPAATPTEDRVPPAETTPFEAPPTVRHIHIEDDAPRREKPQGPLHTSELRRGDVVHDVLSKIEFVEGDVISVVTEAIGLVRPEETGFDRSGIAETVQKFLERPEVAPLFRKQQDRSIKNEQEIASADGRLYRIDRIIEDVDGMTVMDFKTGGRELEDKYRAQVRSYMNLLSGLRPGVRVRGLVAYIDRDAVVEVA